MHDRYSSRAYLLKHSSDEAGKTWWFLDIVDDPALFRWCQSKTMLKFLKDIGQAKFIKRYASEEELNVDADVAYASCAMKSLG